MSAPSVVVLQTCRVQGEDWAPDVVPDRPVMEAVGAEMIRRYFTLATIRRAVAKATVG